MLSAGSLPAQAKVIPPIVKRTVVGLGGVSQVSAGGQFSLALYAAPLFIEAPAS